VRARGQTELQTNSGSLAPQLGEVRSDHPKARGALWHYQEGLQAGLVPPPTSSAAPAANSYVRAERIESRVPQEHAKRASLQGGNGNNRVPGLVEPHAA
jgi:hypothetical protein